MTKRKLSSPAAPDYMPRSARDSDPAESRNRTQVGRAGERRAASYLKKKGYEILERNFRSVRGEVDIIAVDRNTLVFCEVKTWRTISVEELEHAITPEKTRRIFDASLRYLEQHAEYAGFRLRYDVIHISGTPNGGDIRQLPNALERS